MRYSLQKVARHTWGRISQRAVSGVDVPRMFAIAGWNAQRALKMRGILRFETEFNEVTQNTFDFFVHATVIESRMRTGRVLTGNDADPVRMQRSTVEL
jgi:hypothetical protein